MDMKKIGDRIAEFTLVDQNGQPQSLAGLCSGLTLLYFYPKAMTPGCTAQACSLRDARAELDQRGLKVVGISCDAPPRLKRFQEKENLNFTLLSDPDHTLCSFFGVWGPKKLAGREYEGVHRTSFLVQDGIVKAVFPKVKPKNHLDEIVKYLDSLK
ncbi:MAG: thioredoxin-dependent thiol peroxidase [Succinivibrionaceae bacterium]|nr:thioredoxin-dependent thiol peroxidase [Succinivibrionaceae bacterium]